MVGNFIASNDFGSRTSIISGLKSRAIFSVTKYTIKIFWKLKRSTNFIWFLFRRKEEAQPLKNICLSEWFDKERENGGMCLSAKFFSRDPRVFEKSNALPRGELIYGSNKSQIGMVQEKYWSMFQIIKERDIYAI